MMCFSTTEDGYSYGRNVLKNIKILTASLHLNYYQPNRYYSIYVGNKDLKICIEWRSGYTCH